MTLIIAEATSQAIAGLSDESLNELLTSVKNLINQPLPEKASGKETRYRGYLRTALLAIEGAIGTRTTI